MGILVVNTNTSAINAHRNLLNVNTELNRTFEHLSSGERLVRAADGPASIMISEHIRSQAVSVEQAIRNSETSVSMVQTTEAALQEVSQMLVGIRRLAIHAANEGANDELMLEADQQEVDNLVASIDRVSQFSNFGSKPLLDGSNGVTGMVAGDGLSFVKANEDTISSPDEGYAVNVTQGATRAKLVGKTALSREVIDQGAELSVQSMGRIASYTTQPGEDPKTIIRRLQNSVNSNGMDITVSLDYSDISGDPKLVLEHNEYGSEHKFLVTSNIAGVLADDVKVPMIVDNGLDIEGTIGGELAFGRGRVLRGAEGIDASGVEVLYSGEVPADPKEPVGHVNVTQRSLIFQIGPDAGQKVSVAIDTVNSRRLGINVDNDSGFKSVFEIDVRNAQGASDAVKVVDKALDDLNSIRGQLGAIQRNSLESNIRNLRISYEEMMNADSVLRDADMAEEISKLTREQIIAQSAMAVLGQANQTSQNVLRLLNQQ